MQFRIINKINGQTHYKDISTMDELMKIIEHNNVSIEARHDKSRPCPTITILEESAFKLAK